MSGLSELAARVEREAERTAADALHGYDNMRHGPKERDRLIRVAADYFAVAAALRARASGEGEGGSAG